MRGFGCNAAGLHQAKRSIVYVSLFVARWFVAIGAFRSSVKVLIDQLLRYLIVGIQVLGISTPLSRLILLG